jgi:hypothetical protein
LQNILVKKEITLGKGRIFIETVAELANIPKESKEPISEGKDPAIDGLPESDKYPVNSKNMRKEKSTK